MSPFEWFFLGKACGDLEVTPVGSRTDVGGVKQAKLCGPIVDLQRLHRAMAVINSVRRSEG